MANSIEALQFNLIQEELDSYAHSPLAKKEISSLTILPLEKLEKELSYTQEALDLNYRYGAFPSETSFSIEEDLSYALKGGIIPLDKLCLVMDEIRVSISSALYFKKVESSPILLDYIKDLPDLSYTFQELDRCISYDGSMKDEASPTLRNIRHKIARLDKKATELLTSLIGKYKAYCTSATFTIKNGHYALPVSSSYKSKVKGYVQDVSSSGSTYFIEPDELLLIQAEKIQAEAEEKEEIVLILKQLSNHLIGKQDELRLMDKMVGYLDFLNAKAIFARAHKAHVAIVSKNKEIYLPEAIHPLLKVEKKIPNDFYFSSNSRIMIVSGPNAGGKTVALKTLGLLIYCHECGLPISAKEGSAIGYIPHLYCDIGDGQSIQDNLSTFASHIKAVSEIVDHVEENDLVLLDEIGSGTSPKEGEAIAYSTIKFLLDKGCFAMITSHFNGLKEFALSQKEIISSSMLFDQKNMMPTYRLKMGLPGESYAFEVASRYGLSEAIIQEARRYAKEEIDEEKEKAKKRLLELSFEQEKLKKEMEAQKEEIEKQKKEIQNKEALLKQKEDSFDLKLKKKEEEIVEKAKEKVQEVLKVLSSPNVKLHQVIEAKKALEELEEEEIEDPFNGDEDLKLGDYALIPSLDVKGKITSLSKKKATLIDDEGFTYQVERKKLRRSEAPAEKKKLASVDRIIARSTPLEINLIGLHYDEAAYALSSYLDSCRLSHYERVRIIHGLGSGVLKKMTAEYCKAHKEFIDRYETAGSSEGGLGATIVWLKKK